MALLRRVLDVFNSRLEAMAQAISSEMGAPLVMALDSQAYCGSAHFEATIKALEAFEFEEQRGQTTVVYEGIGVCGLITPWNWPMNQIVTKVAPAVPTAEKGQVAAQVRVAASFGVARTEKVLVGNEDEVKRQA